MAMKEGWEIKKLCEVCDTSSGGTPSKSKSEYYEGGNIPWLRSGEINSQYITSTELYITELGLEKSSAKWFPCDTVVIAMYGATVGQVGILKNSMTTNQAVCGILPNTILNSNFLYYFLKSKKEYFINIANGGAQPNISQNVIKSIYVPIPPISDQTRIVEELDLLKGILDKKRQQLKELNALSQSIFYDMFGNPEMNSKKWQLSTIGNISTEVKYGTSSKATADGKYKYLRMNNLTYSGEIDLKDIKFINVDEKEYEKCVVKKGDILFNRTNSKDLVGKTSLFSFEEEMIIAGYIIRVRINKELADAMFVTKYMNLPYMKRYLSNLAKGAVNQANINSQELKSIPIPVPPLTLQTEFANKIKSIEHQKELIKQSIEETQTLLDSRMDYYFN